MADRDPMLIPVPVDDPLPMAWLDCNDLGNAERLVRLSKGLLKWVDEIGWVCYDGRRWSARDGELRATQLAHEVAYHIDREATALHAIADDPEALRRAFPFEVTMERAKDHVVALRKHAVKSGDASRTAGMLAQAKRMLTVRIEDFDRDPLAFNCLNGTLRFHQDGSGQWAVRLDAHEPRDLIMQVANLAYDPEADCPSWVERLRLVQPDADQRRLLQYLFGYCLTGLTSEQKWFIFQGRGGDGKSLTNAVVGELLGDYYAHADVKSFLEGAQRSGADHSSDLARLRGDIRLVCFDEPPTRSTWNASRLKQVTGGRITCRPLREAEIEYVPRWKLIGEVNPLPAVPSDDDGFWRRCRVIPWPYQFDKDGEAARPWDIMLAELTAEASGILNWMIAGALRWLGERRLPAAKRAEEAMAEYRQSASPFGEWLGECCDLKDPKAQTSASDLYRHFKDWCEAAGIEKVPTQTAFGRALRDRQIPAVKDALGNRKRRGIRLRDDALRTPLDDAASGVGGRVAAEPRPPADDDDWAEDSL